MDQIAIITLAFLLIWPFVIILHEHSANLMIPVFVMVMLDLVAQWWNVVLFETTRSALALSRFFITLAFCCVCTYFHWLWHQRHSLDSPTSTTTTATATTTITTTPMGWWIHILQSSLFITAVILKYVQLGSFATIPPLDILTSVLMALASLVFLAYISQMWMTSIVQRCSGGGICNNRNNNNSYKRISSSKQSLVTEVPLLDSMLTA